MSDKVLQAASAEALRIHRTISSRFRDPKEPEPPVHVGHMIEDIDAFLCRFIPPDQEFDEGEDA